MRIKNTRKSMKRIVRIIVEIFVVILFWLLVTEQPGMASVERQTIPTAPPPTETPAPTYLPTTAPRITDTVYQPTVVASTQTAMTTPSATRQITNAAATMTVGPTLRITKTGGALVISTRTVMPTIGVQIAATPTAAMREAKRGISGGIVAIGGVLLLIAIGGLALIRVRQR